MFLDWSRFSGRFSLALIATAMLTVPAEAVPCRCMRAHQTHLRADAAAEAAAPLPHGPSCCSHTVADPTPNTKAKERRAGSATPEGPAHECCLSPCCVGTAPTVPPPTADVLITFAPRAHVAAVHSTDPPAATQTGIFRPPRV